MSESEPIEMHGESEYDEFVKRVDAALGALEGGAVSFGGVMDDQEVNDLVKEARQRLGWAKGVAISRQVTGHPAATSEPLG